MTSPPLSLEDVLGALTLLLALATVVVCILRARAATPTTRELVLRVLTWWGLLAAFALSILVDERCFIVFSVGISCLALSEFFTLVGAPHIDRPVARLALLAVVVQHVFYAAGLPRAGLSVVALAALVVIPTALVVRGETHGFTRRVAHAALGLAFTGFGLGHVAFLLSSDFARMSPASGAGLIVFLVVVTQLNDVLQYLSGKAFGRTPIAPLISPKKTLEGVLGGIVGSALLALLIGPSLLGLPLVVTPFLGALLAVTGFLGDVAVSALKRDVGQKDSGHLLPGHGGVLDRVDSTIFTAPIFAAVLPLVVELAPGGSS